MSTVTYIATLMGQGLILIGLLITGFGVYAILKLDGFYSRIVITSKVEAMGFATVVFGAILITGFTPMAIKLLLILMFELMTVSASAHAVARSSWVSGYQLKAVQLTGGLDGGESDRA